MSKAEALYRLQTIDLEIGERNHRLREVKAILEGNEELQQVEQALQKGEKILSRQRVRLRDQELEMRSLNDKISSVEGRLYGGRIKNPKELGNLQDEVKYLRRRRGELEDQVLLSMIEVEDSEAGVTEQQERQAHLAELWQQTQVRLSAEQNELMDRLGQLMAKRTQLQKTIAAGDLALYEDLRLRRHGQAVAILQGELCQACGVTMPTNKARLARQGDVLTPCGSCERILYVDW